MPAASRGTQKDHVFSKTGMRGCCAYHINTTTNECSENVFVNDYGSVREGDLVYPHAFPTNCCSIDTNTLSKFSNKVFINDKGAGRIGDSYGDDNIITSGSNNVFFG